MNSIGAGFLNAKQSFKVSAGNDLSELGLRAAIILVALLFIGAALVIHNKVALAAILAWMLLP